jgi:hypothetical protein
MSRMPRDAPRRWANGGFRVRRSRAQPSIWWIRLGPGQRRVWRHQHRPQGSVDGFVSHGGGVVRASGQARSGHGSLPSSSAGSGLRGSSGFVPAETFWDSASGYACDKSWRNHQADDGQGAGGSRDLPVRLSRPQPAGIMHKGRQSAGPSQLPDALLLRDGSASGSPLFRVIRVSPSNWDAMSCVTLMGARLISAWGCGFGWGSSLAVPPAYRRRRALAARLRFSYSGPTMNACSRIVVTLFRRTRRRRPPGCPARAGSPRGSIRGVGAR